MERQNNQKWYQYQKYRYLPLHFTFCNRRMRCLAPTRDSRTHISRTVHPGVPPSHLRERSTGRTTRRVLLQAERHSESHAFRRSVFLRPQGKVHRLRSWRRAAGKARITLGAMPGRAPVILQSSLSSESIGLRLICGRDKQQRA